MTRERWIWVGVVTLFLLFGVALYFAVTALSQQPATPPQKKQQIISLVKPPPPPPPEEKMEKPPEPELQEEVEIPELSEMPEEIPELGDEPPPGEQLGLDADGSGGGDAFGLVARKGGRGLLSGDPMAWYAGRLQDCINDLLQDKESIRTVGSYRVDLRVRGRSDGSVEVKVVSSTATDELLDHILTQFDRPIRCNVDQPPQAQWQALKITLIGEGRD